MLGSLTGSTRTGPPRRAASSRAASTRFSSRGPAISEIAPEVSGAGAGGEVGEPLGDGPGRDQLGAHVGQVAHLALGAPLHERPHELVELRGTQHLDRERAGEHGLLVGVLRGVVAAGEPVGADDGHHDDPPDPGPLARPPAGCGSRSGRTPWPPPRRTSASSPRRRCVSTPVRASARPSPVMMSTPRARDIGTTSWPRASRTSTTWRPTRPVAPATAILLRTAMICSFENLAVTALTDRDGAM